MEPGYGTIEWTTDTTFGSESDCIQRCSECMWKSKSMATSSFSLQGSDWEIGSKCGYIHSRHQCMWEKQTLATCFGFLSSHEGQNSETQRHHLCFHTRSNCTSPRRPRVRDKTKLVARAIINTWKPPEATEKGPKWGKQKNLTISEIGHGNGEMNTAKTFFFLVEKNDLQILHDIFFHCQCGCIWCPFGVVCLGWEISWCN